MAFQTAAGQSVVAVTAAEIEAIDRVAVATSVFTLGIAAGAGALVHALSASPVWYVVAWSIPGVLVGGTIGTRVGKYVPSDLMEAGLGVVFGLVGALVLGVEVLV